MPLYRTADSRWVSTQKEAGKGYTSFDVPKTVPELLQFLNDNTPSAETAAYKQGIGDGERGISSNPYASPDEKAEWERGYAEAYAKGQAPHPSFYVQTRKRVGKR